MHIFFQMEKVKNANQKAKPLIASAILHFKNSVTCLHTSILMEGVPGQYGSKFEDKC